ncbi:RNA polymerase sigma factor [Marinicella litoralis]|uniref:RNA polymerase sigma factor (Sigma-70 family) n=1 Tax=Marinicella litoralis TaxID=644220 RepID=A0A4R6XDP5_9GAMM|nr:RNA polymerase sigma factor [Marinicella litoralis]TDR17426.1 RNA polymerase sigma factor (sigma-70 family) [Marinicella litoralis]
MFNHFFDFYFPRLYRFSLVRVDGDKELTKDLVQETLFLAIKNIKQYRGEASLMSWLCQINRSQISLYFKKNNIKQTVRVSDLPEVQEIFDNIKSEIKDHPDKQYETSKLHEIISSTLDNLPNGYGDLLEMKYLDKLSVNEIAADLSLSVTSVQSKLARARESFKIVITRILGDQTRFFLNPEESSQ